MKIYRFVTLIALLVMLLSACSAPTPTQAPAPTQAPVPTEIPASGSTSSAPTSAPVATPTLKTPTSKTLNLYAWSDYVPQQLLDDFTAKYGITVNYDTYSSNEEMLAKLQAGASGYDVSIPSDYAVDIMIKQGMLEKIDLSQIPNFANLDKRFTNQYYDPGNQLFRSVSVGNDGPGL